MQKSKKSSPKKLTKSQIKWLLENTDMYSFPEPTLADVDVYLKDLNDDLRDLKRKISQIKKRVKL